MHLENQKNQAFHQQITLLKSFMIGVAGRDPEGNYRSEFVERTLRAVEEKPIHRFTSSSDFLKKIRS